MQDIFSEQCGRELWVTEEKPRIRDTRKIVVDPKYAAKGRVWVTEEKPRIRDTRKIVGDPK